MLRLFDRFRKRPQQGAWSASADPYDGTLIVHASNRTYNNIGWNSEPISTISCDADNALTGPLIRSTVLASRWDARRRFPSADFRIGDLLNSGLEDDAFDLSFVHDLFEHLSIPAMERAIRELLRVTRREVWLHFFHAGDIPSHRIRPVACYHWNALSVCELVGVVEQSATRVEVVSIADLAKTKFGFGRYYNPGAYTIIATK